MYMLKQIFEFLLSPMGIMSILFLLGLIMIILKRSSTWARGFLVAGALLFLVFTFSPIADILIRQLEIKYPPLTSQPPFALTKHIAVLSHYTEDDPAYPITSNVSEETLFRAAETMRLYRMLPESRIIVSGGFFKGSKRSQASLMSEYLQTLRIPKSAIILEEQSIDTYENLMEIRKIVGVQPFILVTSAHHLPRAMAVAHRLGMKAIPAPAGITILHYYPPGMSCTDWIQAIIKNFYPFVSRWQNLQRAYHEYLGYLWYMLLNRI
jgi:uncharacterized SAM-binding protein YcdF (DUF218 family)